MAKLAINMQVYVTNMKMCGALARVLGAISYPKRCSSLFQQHCSTEGKQCFFIIIVTGEDRLVIQACLLSSTWLVDHVMQVFTLT